MNDVNNRIFYEFSEFLKETESVPPEMRVSLAYEITRKIYTSSTGADPGWCTTNFRVDMASYGASGCNAACRFRHT